MIDGFRISKSSKLVKWLNHHISDIILPSDDRTVLAAGCFDVSLECHRATIALVKLRLNGAAFAMVRPQYESYVRGLWLQHCASSLEIHNFMDDKFDKSMNIILEDLMTAQVYDSNLLSEVKNKWWAPMCSFSHCGFAQVSRRVTISDIGPDYTDDELVDVLEFCDTISLLVARSVAALADNVELKIAIAKRAGVI